MRIVDQSKKSQDDLERISKLADTLVEVANQLRALIEDLKSGNLPEDRPIETLGLSTKTFNRIVGNYGRNRENSPFQTIRDILDVPEYAWYRVIGVGSKATAKEIEEKMHEAGFPDFRISLARGYKAR